MLERLRFAAEIHKENKRKDYILSNVFDAVEGEKYLTREQLLALAQEQVDNYPTDSNPRILPPGNLKSVASTLHMAGTIRNYEKAVSIWEVALEKEAILARSMAYHTEDLKLFIGFLNRSGKYLNQARRWNNVTQKFNSPIRR